MNEVVLVTPKVYISGAISGMTPEEFRSNFDKGVALAEEEGYEAVNPCNVVACEDHNCYEGKLDGAFPISGGGGPDADFVHHWTCYMKHDIIAMLDCDGIIMLPNYLRSRGAQRELEVAKDCGLYVLYIDEDYKEIRDRA